MVSAGEDAAGGFGASGSAAGAGTMAGAAHASQMVDAEEGRVSAGMPLHRTPEQRRARARLMASKVAVSVVGGFAFAWGAFLLALALAVRAGYPYGEMQALFGGLTFVVYVPAFVWSYVSANQKLVWLVLAGGGTLMLLLAWWLQPA